MRDRPLCGSPCDYFIRPGVSEEGDDEVALVVSLVVDKTLARLASFIHDSYPESHLLSAPPLTPWYDFATLLVLSTPESHRPPFRLSPTASPASFSGPSSRGGGVCAASGSPSGVPALYDFHCSLGLSLFVRSYKVLLSILYFLRLLAAVPLRWSGGLQVSILGTTSASPVISA